MSQDHCCGSAAIDDADEIVVAAPAPASLPIGDDDRATRIETPFFRDMMSDRGDPLLLKRQSQADAYRRFLDLRQKKAAVKGGSNEVASPSSDVAQRVASLERAVREASRLTSERLRDIERRLANVERRAGVTAAAAEVPTTDFIRPSRVWLYEYTSTAQN